jgi:hypothetical protein
MKLTEEIKKYARQTPFRPFAIETDSGSRFVIADSYHVAIDENRGRVVVFDLEGLVEIIDLDAVHIVSVP